jgi:hypothetical protein
MDHMEADSVIYVKVGTLNQLEQSKICVSSTILEIALLTAPH